MGNTEMRGEEGVTVDVIMILTSTRGKQRPESLFDTRMCFITKREGVDDSRRKG